VAVKAWIVDATMAVADRHLAVVFKHFWLEMPANGQLLLWGASKNPLSTFTRRRRTIFLHALAFLVISALHQSRF